LSGGEILNLVSGPKTKIHRKKERERERKKENSIKEIPTTKICSNMISYVRE